LQAITRRLKREKRGISTVIVVMLSLVLVVIIVGNVLLWSYQMNQLDWEKMQERVNIVSTQSVNENWAQNPTAYALKGSTSWVSGDILDLVADDSVYMTFRSYYLVTGVQDFVDNNLSNLDSSPNKGTHSNFTAQQYGPDSIYDTLTEENSGISSNSTLLDDGFEDFDWDANWDAIPHNWQEDNFPVHSGLASAHATGFSQGYFTSDSLDASDASAIYVDFWFRKTETEYFDFTLYHYDGSSYDLIDELDDNGFDNTWLHYTAKISDNQYFVSNFRLRFDATLGFGEEVWVDDVLIIKEVNQNNHQLDLEVQWTNVNFDETSEQLCIYGGTMGGENIRVDVWTGSTWNNLFSDLSFGWNNVSVSSYLTSSTFTIRFKDGTETSDNVQDSWDIDATLLRVGVDEYNVEVEFTGLSNVEEWTQLLWTTNVGWTIGSVNVTLQLYDFALDGYATSGDGYIAYTSDSSPDVDENRSQTINIKPTDFRNATRYWKIKIKGTKIGTTQFDLKVDWVEFRETKLGTLVTFENGGSLTSHLVSLWVNNSTNHQRYEMNLFISPGETTSYFSKNVVLSDGSYTLKVSTERGNIAVFSED